MVLLATYFSFAAGLIAVAMISYYCFSSKMGKKFDQQNKLT
jgi:hypothetical protein